MMFLIHDVIPSIKDVTSICTGLIVTFVMSLSLFLFSLSFIKI